MIPREKTKAKRAISEYRSPWTSEGAIQRQNVTVADFPAYFRNASVAWSLQSWESEDRNGNREEVWSRGEWHEIESAVMGLFGGRQLAPGEMYRLHSMLRRLCRSSLSSLVCDYYRGNLLARGMACLREGVLGEPARVLDAVAAAWDDLYKDVLPTLQALLRHVKTKTLSIRDLTLVGFRDEVLLAPDVGFEDAVRNHFDKNSSLPLPVTQMLLVVSGVRDTYPPSENYLRLERCAALAVNPFLGYLGLYEGGNEPTVHSSEPMLDSTRRSSSIAAERRLSRPLSVQSGGVETLADLFRKAYDRTASPKRVASYF